MLSPGRMQSRGGTGAYEWQYSSIQNNRQGEHSMNAKPFDFNDIIINALERTLSPESKS